MLRPRSSRHVASALLGSPAPNISPTCGSPAPPAPSPQSSSYIPIASNMPTSCGTGARAPRARPIQYSVTVPPSDLVASDRSVPGCTQNPISGEWCPAGARAVGGARRRVGCAAPCVPAGSRQVVENAGRRLLWGWAKPGCVGVARVALELAATAPSWTGSTGPPATRSPPQRRRVTW